MINQYMGILRHLLSGWYRPCCLHSVLLILCLKALTWWIPTPPFIAQSKLTSHHGGHGGDYLQGSGRWLKRWDDRFVPRRFFFELSFFGADSRYNLVSVTWNRWWWYCMMWCDVIWYDVKWCDVIWYDMLCYDMMMRRMRNTNTSLRSLMKFPFRFPFLESIVLAYGNWEKPKKGLETFGSWNDDFGRQFLITGLVEKGPWQKPGPPTIEPTSSEDDQPNGNAGEGKNQRKQQTWWWPLKIQGRVNERSLSWKRIFQQVCG